MAKINLFKVIINTERILKDLEPVLASGYIGQGPQCEKLERSLEKLWCKPEKSVLIVNSCTSALELALHLYGVTFGTEVITTPIGCSASAAAIVSRGGRIVWCDVDPLSGLALVEDIKSKITPRTKAILVVDWAGQPCDYLALKTLGIPIIADCAHGFLTSYEGKHISDTDGITSCFSFQAIKHLTMADGGAIVVPPELYARAKLLRWFGLDREHNQKMRCDQNIQESGFKFQCTDIDATIGLANLDLAVRSVVKSRDNSRFYCENIQNPLVYQAPFNEDSSYWLHTILVDNREGFISYMDSLDIETNPAHRKINKHACYNFPNGPLLGVDFFDERQTNIPNGAWISDTDRLRIVEGVNGWNAK